MTLYEKVSLDEEEATHQARHPDWMCTKCYWKGNYSSTVGVIYHGVDWQHCPSCNSVAIPTVGSTKSVKRQYLSSKADDVDMEAALILLATRSYIALMARDSGQAGLWHAMITEALLPLGEQRAPEEAKRILATLPSKEQGETKLAIEPTMSKIAGEPSFIEDKDMEEYLQYLDELRESGTVNMVGAAVNLREEFGLSRPQSRSIHRYWIETFKERRECRLSMTI